MVVQSPEQPKISSSKFFNKTAKVNQEVSVLPKDKLVQIDGSLKKILSIREKSVDVTRIEEQQTQRQEKEKKLEAGKFFVRGVGKLANKIPGKNTVQKFLIFMAFGWLFNTFSKYFGELSGPLSKIITGSVTIIDTFSKIAFAIFDGFATFVDIGYKTWDVIRGTGDSQKLQSAMNNVLLDIDSFFGGILSLLGIVEQPPETPQPTPTPAKPGAPSAPRGPSPGAPAQTYTGGILPSTKLGPGPDSRAGDRKHPLTGQVRFHAGNDYPMDPGTPITVLKGGKVTRSEVNGSMTSGYGNLIEIQHPDGSKSVYAHLNQRNVLVGDTIKPGTVIGTVGSTGGSTGPHLHFEYDNPNGQTERSWQTINSKADQIFRFGNVKPSQTYKLALKNGKEGVIIDGKWKPQKWTKQEKERYERVHGQQEQAKASPAGGSIDSLFRLISRGEGGVNSVNRGVAGDTPGGAKSIFGKNLTDMTVDEIYAKQREGRVNAVGKYQIIEITMPGFIKYLKSQGIDTSKTKFTENIQDKFKPYVVDYKRPEVGQYIRGKSNNRKEAAQQLAREFASIGLSYPEAGRSRGESRYSGTAGNRASISPESIENALDRARSGKKGGGIIGDIPKQSKNINPSSLSSYPSYSESGTMMLIQPIIIEKPVPMSMNKSKTTFPSIGGVNSSGMNNFRG